MWKIALENEELLKRRTDDVPDPKDAFIQVDGSWALGTGWQKDGDSPHFLYHKGLDMYHDIEKKVFYEPESVADGGDTRKTRRMLMECDPHHKPEQFHIHQV